MHYNMFITDRNVAELKGRTSSQLPLLNQSVSAIQRDNE